MPNWMIVGSLLVSLISSPYVGSNACGVADLTGACSVASSGSSVTVGASVHSGGDSSGSGGPGGGGSWGSGGGSGGGGSGGSGRGWGSGGSGGGGEPVDPCESKPLEACYDGFFTTTEPATPAPAAPDPPTVLPRVTLTDLASFTPEPATVTGEPIGVGLVMGETNVIATANTQTQTGTVLSFPVTVTFTPAGYVFDYGDGTITRSSTGGASWDAINQAQGTRTDTSHIYRERGEYLVAVVVEYAATVTFPGGTTQTVPGVIAAPAGAYPIRIYRAHTALVEHTCIEDPTGPGCPTR